MKLNLDITYKKITTNTVITSLVVDTVAKVVMVGYALELLSPDGEVIATKQGQYRFGDDEASSLHALEGADSTTIRTKVAGERKATRWIDQLAPALLPAIEAELQELHTPAE